MALLALAPVALLLCAIDVAVAERAYGVWIRVAATAPDPTIAGSRWDGVLAPFCADLTNDISAEVVSAHPPLACSPLTTNATGRAVVAVRGNCTFTEKAFWAQRAGAVALLLVNNNDEPLIVSGANSSLVIPTVMFWNRADGETLMRHTLAPVTLHAVRAPVFDASAAVLLVIALACVIGGAYASSAYERAQQRHRYLQLDTPPPAAPDEDAVAFLDERAALGFIVCASIALVTMYYLIDYLIYVLIFMFAFAGVQAAVMNYHALAPSISCCRVYLDRMVDLPVASRGRRCGGSQRPENDRVFD